MAKIKINKKQVFRESKKWKDFRKKLIERDKVDFITQAKLQPTANCHHLDMSDDNYENISDESHFVMLNKRTHRMVHTLFLYYKKDHEILNRLKVILDKMLELNN